MTDLQNRIPARFPLSDRAWMLTMCVIIGVAASTTSYFVATGMKDNYMNGLRAGLEIGGLMTKIEKRTKAVYSQVPQKQTTSDETSQIKQPQG